MCCDINVNYTQTATFSQNVYILQKKNQNLWGNLPPNICENIPPSSSYLTFRPTSAGARFRLAIFRGSVYPRQSK